MRVLVLDHMAVQRAYRQRYVELSKMDKIQLSVVAPSEWIENFRVVFFENKTNDEKNYNLLSIKTVFKGKSHRGFYFPHKLAAYIDEIKPDIFHVMAEPESLFSLQLVLMRNLISKKSEIILVSWRNIDYRLHGFPYRPPGLYRMNDKYTLQNSDAIMVFSETAREIFQNYNYRGIIKVIPWGVDLAKFKKIEVRKLKKRLGLNTFTIGFVGRFEKAKGVQFLIRAVSEIKEDFKLLLIGDGPEKRCWLKYADELRIKNRIIHINSVNYAEIPLFLNCMDVLTLPSLTTGYWKEQFGRVLIEAMACEVPVIGSDSGEIPNIIGNAGIIFKEGDAEDLKRKLLLLMNSSTMRAKMIYVAKERISNIFSWPKIAQKTYELYLETLALQDNHTKLI